MNVMTVYEMMSTRGETRCRGRRCVRANKNSVAGRISWGSAAMMPDGGAVRRASTGAGRSRYRCLKGGAR